MDFNYKIDYEKWAISFSKSFRDTEEDDNGKSMGKTKIIDKIKTATFVSSICENMS